MRFYSAPPPRGYYADPKNLVGDMPSEKVWWITKDLLEFAYGDPITDWRLLRIAISREQDFPSALFDNI